MRLLVVSTVLAVAFASVAPLVAATHDTTSPVLNADTDTAYPSISAAVAAAFAGETILVRPGTYVESFTISVPVTLCASGAGGLTCSPSPADTIVHGTITVAATGASILGFTLENPTNTATGAADASLLVIQGDDVVVRDNVLQSPFAPRVPGASIATAQAIRLDPAGERAVISFNTFRSLGSARGPDGTCTNLPCAVAAVAAPTADSYGHYFNYNTVRLPTGQVGGAPESIGLSVFSGHNYEVRENDVAPDTGAVAGGYYGVFGIFRSSTFQENEFVGAQQGIFLRTMIGPFGNQVRGNTFRAGNEGVLNYAEGTQIEENTFVSNNNAVRLAGDPLTTGTSAGATFLGNVMIGNARNLVLHTDVSGLALDARYNNWGAYTRSGVEDSVDDRGTGNSVDTTCWYDVDGTTPICPPTASFTFAPTTPHRLTAVQFTDTSVSGGRDIASWAWDFGDGETSADASPAHEFAASGVKTVTLVVTDSEGYTSLAQDTVSVQNAAPVVAPIPARTVTEGDLLRVWVGSSDPDGDAVAWTVAGRPAGVTLGTYVNGTIVLTWRPGNAQAGTHTVTFTASDGELSDSEALVVTVLDANRLPVVAFAGPALVAAGATATWTSLASDPDGDTLVLAWSSSDGGSGAGTSFARAFAAGSYTITLTANDGRGGVVSATRTIVADGTAPVTTATPDVPAPAPGWYAGPVEFTLAATDAGGAGVASIRYSADGAAFRTATASAVRFTGDGAHTLRFYAIDRVGNAEPLQSLSFSIDSAAPDLSVDAVDGNDATPLVVATGGGLLSDTVMDFVGVASDGGSGVASVELVVDGVVVDSHVGGGAFALEWDHAGAVPGAHSVVVRATDAVGHATEASFVVAKVPLAIA